MTRKKKYSKEFKLDAVNLVLEQNYSKAAAARSLEVNPNLLGRWVNEFKEDDGGFCNAVKWGKTDNHVPYFTIKS